MRPHPGSVGLAAVAEGKDHDNTQDGQDHSEQDDNIIVGLGKRGEKEDGGKRQREREGGRML